MKKIAVYSIFVTFVVLLGTSCISASEPKTLVQDILTNSANRWKNLHQLPRQLISSMILHNHPIVPFILNKGDIVVKTLNDYPCKIKSAVFNSEEDMILTCSYDGTVKLWDTSSGKCLNTLRGTNDNAIYAVFNIAGDMVVTCSYDKTPKLWETRSGKCLQDLKGHTDTVNTAAFNNSGDRILTSSSDGSAKLWDTDSGVCLHTIKQNPEKPNLAKFSSSGDVVLTISGKDDTSTVKLWETNSGKCLHTLEGHTGSIWLAEFSNSGDLVLTISDKDDTSTVKLWETRSGKCLHILDGHTCSVLYAELSGSGDLIITAPRYGRAKLWDTSSGECLKIFDHINIRSAKFNHLGDRILTNCGLIVKLWDTNSRESLQTLIGHTAHINTAELNYFNSAEFNSEGDLILTFSGDGTVKIWGTSSGKCLKTLERYYTDDFRSHGLIPAVFNSLGDRVLTVHRFTYRGGASLTYRDVVKLHDISLFQKLRNFFSQDGGVTFNQAVVLIGIYEIIICRKLRRKKLSSRKLYFRRLKDSLKSLSSATEEQAISSDRVTFDFRKCPHLQEDYEKLPPEIRRILDKYVRKTASKNDCSIASTTDISDFESASTSEES